MSMGFIRRTLVHAFPSPSTSLTPSLGRLAFRGRIQKQPTLSPVVVSPTTTFPSLFLRSRPLYRSSLRTVATSMSPINTPPGSPKTESFYDLKAELKNGKMLDFADLRGKPVLLFNGASKCGFTGQYSGLQALHEKFKDQGLVVLGFPCNQFGGQEPGNDAEVETFCQVNHGVTFQLAKKSDVNGEHANEVFRYIKHAAPGILGLTRVKWNFEKWLVSPDGQTVKRYASTTSPTSIERDIEAFFQK